MTEARCWDCDKKLADVTTGASGAVFIICPRCGSRNRVILDSPSPAVVRYATSIGK